jgi:hypothetical protein
MQVVHWQECPEHAVVAHAVERAVAGVLVRPFEWGPVRDNALRMAELERQLRWAEGQTRRGAAPGGSGDARKGGGGGKGGGGKGGGGKGGGGKGGGGKGGGKGGANHGAGAGDGGSCAMSADQALCVRQWLLREKAMRVHARLAQDAAQIAAMYEGSAEGGGGVGIERLCRAFDYPPVRLRACVSCGAGPHAHTSRL